MASNRERRAEKRKVQSTLRSEGPSQNEPAEGTTPAETTLSNPTPESTQNDPTRSEIDPQHSESAQLETIREAADEKRNDSDQPVEAAPSSIRQRVYLNTLFGPPEEESTASEARQEKGKQIAIKDPDIGSPPNKSAHEIEAEINEWSGMAERSVQELEGHLAQQQALQQRILSDLERANRSKLKVQEIRQRWDAFRGHPPAPQRASVDVGIQSDYEFPEESDRPRPLHLRFAPQESPYTSQTEGTANRWESASPVIKEEPVDPPTHLGVDSYDQHNRQEEEQASARVQVPRTRSGWPPQEDQERSIASPYRPELNPRALSDDYHRRMNKTRRMIQAASAPISYRSANLAAPFAPPAPPIMMVPPTASAAISHARVHLDHEAEMINNLIRHIRNSLSEIPHDLPEIKGLRVNLPEAYAGEDDIDKLDNWLQGLLRHFKLNRLTANNRDADRILVTGTCLKGKAERWFNHEVERPSRVTPDWTFETVIIGLFRSFITTATAQQAVRRYGQVKYTQEEGVTAFHRELLLWAGRLTQYPDEYSFKRRIFNGLPKDLRHHLTLYEGVSAEMSSIDDIVSRARHVEKIFMVLGSEHRSDGHATPGTPGTAKMHQRSTRSNDRSGARNTERSSIRHGGKINPPVQKSGPKPVPTSASPQSGKGDTSKLTCYKCGKIGHISTDPKCPQYKPQKTVPRQMFAAQVIDDRSENDQPGGDQSSGESEEPEPGAGGVTEDQSDPDNHPNDPDGSQYDEDDTPHEEYDGYAMPSEDDSEIEYIRMVHETSNDQSDHPLPFDHMDWKPRYNEIRVRYEVAPWMPHDTLEFTPQYSVTHSRGCDVCASFKEHAVMAKALKGNESFAWKTRDKFEKDLISLGWTMALLDAQRSSGNPPGLHINTIQDLNASLERDNHRLQMTTEMVHQINSDALKKCRRLEGVIEEDHLELDMRRIKADLIQSQLTQVAQYCADLEGVVDPTQIERLINESNDNRIAHSLIPSRKTHSFISNPEEDAIARIAATRSNDPPKDREFRSAQRRKYATGERPRSTINDRRCMAALVKINGLEAYALLDTGSTTVSITHDFARVANLSVIQLDNPITLQLGTVGSRSVINFGSRASLELGPIKDNDIYLDVVNIDRYDMIIGTPFMRKHGLIMDFNDNTLKYNNQPVPTMTAGQEDLMIERKRSARIRNPTSPGRTISRNDH